MSCNCKRTRPARVLLPAIALAVVPKCPLCIVAYASSIGIGVSLSTATTVRHVVVATCLVILGAALARSFGARRWIGNHEGTEKRTQVGAKDQVGAQHASSVTRALRS